MARIENSKNERQNGFASDCGHVNTLTAPGKYTHTNEGTMSYWRTVFIDRREGLITLIGSLIYLAVWTAHTYKPALSPVPPFYGMLSLYIAIALGLVYAQMGGFSRKKFESGLFNTVMLVLVMLVPFGVAIQSALRR